MTIRALDTQIHEQFNTVVAQFLFDIAESSEKWTFKDLADQYLPPDHLERYESMAQMKKLTIKQLRFALARRNNRHLSGSKDVLIHRLWKVLHPKKCESTDKIEYLEWNKKRTDPDTWPAIWVERKGSTGVVLKNAWDSEISDVQKTPILLRVDLSRDPPLAFSETAKEYILEGEYDPEQKRVFFGKVPESIGLTPDY